MKTPDISPALKYFFKKLEKKSTELEELRLLRKEGEKEVPFDEVEKFFRALKTQNLFIHTVGMSGKPTSLLLEKAIFNLNKVIRVYYSTSFDEDKQGFVRIRVDKPTKLIVVERMHGYRPKSELMYASGDECHVIRFMVRWLLRRMDWGKTKLENLDLYQKFLDHEKEELERQMEEERIMLEEREIQEAIEKHFGGDGIQIKSSVPH